MEDVLTYLRVCAFHVRTHMGSQIKPNAVGCMQELILNHGLVFQKVERAPRGLRGTPKACFQNARRLALLYPKQFVYVEGVASAIIPVHHAWVYDVENQRALELTWADDIPMGTYVGIPFNPTYYRRFKVNNLSISLLDAWTHRNNPLLDGRSKPSDFHFGDLPSAIRIPPHPNFTLGAPKPDSTVHVVDTRRNSEVQRKPKKRKASRRPTRKSDGAKPQKEAKGRRRTHR